jgi:HlyD family secretion protein
MSKKSIYLLIGGAVVVIALLIILSKTGVIGNKDEGKEVETAVVNAITIVETVSATGKIQPEIEVKISSEVSGEIILLPVVEGQVVKKGDLLVKINPDLYTSSLNRTIAGLSGSKAGLAQAEAQFREAKASYERNKILFQKESFLNQIGINLSLLLKLKASKESAYFSVKVLRLL